MSQLVIAGRETRDESQAAVQGWNFKQRAQPAGHRETEGGMECTAPCAGQGKGPRSRESISKMRWHARVAGFPKAPRLPMPGPPPLAVYVPEATKCVTRWTRGAQRALDGACGWIGCLVSRVRASLKDEAAAYQPRRALCWMPARHPRVLSRGVDTPWPIDGRCTLPYSCRGAKRLPRLGRSVVCRGCVRGGGRDGMCSVWFISLVIAT